MPEANAGARGGGEQRSKVGGTDGQTRFPHGKTAISSYFLLPCRRRPWSFVVSCGGALLLRAGSCSDEGALSPGFRIKMWISGRIRMDSVSPNKKSLLPARRGWIGLLSPRFLALLATGRPRVQIPGRRQHICDISALSFLFNSWKSPVLAPRRLLFWQMLMSGRSSWLVNESSEVMGFFSEYGDASRYKIEEIIGKGSYGVVCSAIDRQTGDRVAIKKISNIFEHLTDAARILREIKLLRLLRHPDIVQIKHIMLPPSRRDFRDIFVVFELMDTDLHQVIKANDDLTKEHYQFFLYQMLRALKYIHTANVYHRDLKPKNILANANCRLKICDFGLARVAFNDTPTTVFWTDYVATRWYRAPELCGSFFTKYSPAIDTWSIGCIFAEILTGKPLFPGKNVVHQLDLMTDLLGSPSTEIISRIRNEKARRYLSSMRKKLPVPFSQKFPNADPAAVKLLQKLLAFDPKDRPTAEEALADPYFKGLAKVEREPSCEPISKMEFEFERRKVTKEDVKELIFREILEYHPQLLKDYTNGSAKTNFLYPSAVDNFRRQFANLEVDGGKGGAPERKHVSLPRTTTVHSTPIPTTNGPASQVPQRIPTARPGRVIASATPIENAAFADRHMGRRMARDPAAPPAAAVGYHLKPDCSDRQQHQKELEKDRVRYRPTHHFRDARVAPEADFRPSPYYIPPFNGIAAVAGGYSKGGAAARAMQGEVESFR